MPPAVHRTMKPSEWGVLVALSVLWGGSFFFTHIALQALPPLTFVALRVGPAALVLLGAVAARRERMPRDRRVWGAFLGMGFLNNAVPFCLIVWGQTQIPSGLAAILNATAPLSTVVIAHVLTVDEPMSGNRLAGVIVGFFGIVVMVGPLLLTGIGAGGWAQLAVLAAAVSYSFAGVYGRRFRGMEVAPLVTAAGQLTASTVLLLPVALVVDRPLTLAMPGLPVWGAVFGTAVLSTALAYVLYFRILASAGATNLLLVTFLIPVSAVALGAVILGERLDPRHFAGMALIGCGLAAIDGRLLARARSVGSGWRTPASRSKRQRRDLGASPD